MRRVVIISQARMGSTRLPGKVLHSAAGKPFLQHHVERLRRARRAAEVWVATTELAQDEPIVDLCHTLGVGCFRGDESDVLSRYHGAATAAGAEIVVRVTSDCPLIDPDIVDQVIARVTEGPGVDYASNTLVRSYPRGLDCEAFPVSVLAEADEQAVRPEEREHVTPYIYWRPERFRVVQLVSSSDLSGHRWTVDTAEDEQLVRRLCEAATARRVDFDLADLLKISAEHPEWSQLNAHVQQKLVHK